MPIVKILVCLMVFIGAWYAPSLAVAKDDKDKQYTDLKKNQKAKLRYMKFLRKECFFKKIREIDDGKIDPIRLARRIERECPSHEKKIRDYMQNKLFMSDDFIKDYIRMIQEDVLASLVPYILKLRNEKRRIRDGF